MRGSETSHSIWIKFCRMVDIPDVITCANFGEDRLRGLGVAGGQILPFSIDFDRRHGLSNGVKCYLGGISHNFGCILLQKTWLSNVNCNKLSDISDDFAFFHSLSMAERIALGVFFLTPIWSHCLWLLLCCFESVIWTGCHTLLQVITGWLLCDIRILVNLI